jgi:hypothetical protein
MIDTFGYNDREIAAGPWAFEVPRDQPRRYAPGQMKWNLDYTLERYAPDVFFQVCNEWADRLRAEGYRRYVTGKSRFRSSGEIWIRPPLCLDTSGWE